MVHFEKNGYQNDFDRVLGVHSSAIRSKETNAFYPGRLREYDLVEIQVQFLFAYIIYVVEIFFFD